MNESLGDSILRHLGIIVVHFGEVSRTINCIYSLAKAIQMLKSSYPMRVSVLIVDNSGNLSLEDNRSLEDFEIRCLKSEKNLGYAGACYIGAKLLKDSSLLLFSNNDVVFSEDSLTQLLRTLDSLPEAGAVQPLVLTKNGLRVDSAGLTCNGIMHGFNYSNWPIKPPNKCFTANGVKVMECFGIDGMAFAIRKKVWDEVGGWDPTFFMFNEDGLLSWKLRLRGYKNYVALSSIIYHERGGTAKGYFTKKEPIFPSYYISRNKILSILYVHEGILLVAYFFLSLFFEFAKNLVLSVKNRSGINIYYYFKALTSVLRNRKHIVDERKKVFRKYSARYFLKKGYILSLKTSIGWLLKRRETILE